MKLIPLIMICLIDYPHNLHGLFQVVSIIYLIQQVDQLILNIIMKDLKKWKIKLNILLDLKHRDLHDNFLYIFPIILLNYIGKYLLKILKNLTTVLINYQN